MKFKGHVFLLFLSSSALAYNQQEMTWLIQHPSHQFQQVLQAKQNTEILHWQALQGPRMESNFKLVPLKQNNAVIVAYHPNSYGSLYKSIDGGQTWKTLSTLKDQKPRDLISIDDHRLLLAADNQIYLSSDQGEHWTLSATIDDSCDKLFSPNPNLILLTTNFSYSMAGIYRSTDGGKTFMPARLGLNDGFPFFDVGGNDHVLVAGTNGLFVSTNNGLWWTQASANWASQILSSTAVNHQNIIFAATYDGLYKTDAQGQGWEKLNDTLGKINLIKIDDNDRLFAMAEQDGSSLFRSLDLGKTWQLLNKFKKMTDMVLLENGKIIVNTNDGLMQSDESQLHFTKLPSFPYAASDSALTLAMDANHFYATASINSSPLYASGDAGKTWNLVRKTAVNDLIAFNHKVITLEYDNNNLQIAASSDNGKTWQAVFEIKNNICHSLSSQNGGLIVNCEKDSYFTQDLLHWTPLKMEARNPTLSSYYSGKTLYVTDGNFIKSSNDNGTTWKTLLDNLNQYRAYVAGYKDEVLIIAIVNAGMIKMTNDGKTWDLINEGFSDYGFSNLIVIDANHYLVSTQSGVFATQDGGKHWMLENEGLTNTHVLNLSLNQNILLAGTEGSGVFEAGM